MDLHISSSSTSYAVPSIDGHALTQNLNQMTADLTPHRIYRHHAQTSAGLPLNTVRSAALRAIETQNGPATLFNDSTYTQGDSYAAYQGGYK
jgi:hypothetical protein